MPQCKFAPRELLRQMRRVEQMEKLPWTDGCPFPFSALKTDPAADKNPTLAERITFFLTVTDQCFFKFILSEVQLNYNVIYITAIQQSNSVNIYTYI